MPMILAIEGGGTHSAAGLYAEDGRLVAERQGGPANPVSMGVSACLDALVALTAPLLEQTDAPVSALAAIAGARTTECQMVIAEGLRAVRDLESAAVCPDLHPILWANAPYSPGILALAGTGSGVIAKNDEGAWLHLGGRGPTIGDQGSAWALAVGALRAAFDALDDGHAPGLLMQTLVTCAGVKEIDALPAWAAEATKDRIAALARHVVAAAEQGDDLAQQCLEAQASGLARLVRNAQQRLQLPPATPLFLAGGLLRGAQAFRVAFLRAVADSGAALTPSEPPLSGHRAVHAVALLSPQPPWLTTVQASLDATRRRQATVVHSIAGSRNRCFEDQDQRQRETLPPTEQVAVDGRPLDELDAKGIVEHMSRCDAAVIPAIAAQSDKIAELIEAAAKTIRNGGRIIYVGAGTSGRLGVLDAAECPPTFGVDPDRVIALIAGGDAAFRQSIEGAEDDVAQAADDIAAANVCENDLVVGITASGTTPYVIAALRAATKQGATTALLCCNPAVDAAQAGLVIALDTGPEALAGSTRLKAGTATKMVLNMVSTGAMALAGYVYQGMMTHMRPANAKLRRRAARIIARLAGIPERRAVSLLREADWRIPVAVVMALKGMDAATAEMLLHRSGRRLRDVL